MSELREECYKCLSNQSCPGAAEYGSILCMTRRKYRMPENGEDRIYAHKFAIIQKQIDEKDAIIKKLEEENKKNVERYEERDNEVWERVKQCKNMQTETDRLYVDNGELQQAYLHEKLAKEEVEELLENSITKQKVKDKIKELTERKKSLIYTEPLETIQKINAKIQVLEELLDK